MTFIPLLKIKDYDDIVYSHSINVGILSMNLAKKMQLDTEFIKQIGTGALLHDLGKLAIPKSILPKIVDCFLENLILPKTTVQKKTLKEKFVVLNTGEIAKVVGSHKTDEEDMTPIVDIIINSKKQKLKKPIRVDLLKDESRTIVKIIEK